MSGANFDAEIRLDIGPFIGSIQKAQAEVKKLSGQIDEINKKSLKVQTSAAGSRAGSAAPGAASNTAVGAGSKARIAAAKEEIVVQTELAKVEKAGAQQRSGSISKLQKEQQQAQRGLARERYALYDVAATYAIVSGAAILALNSTVGAAIDYERAFANVQRTTDDFFTSFKLGEAARVAKVELKELASQIPVTFQELTQIATIGNQLGISQGAIAVFTETVSKFASATGMTVDAVAMSFGRIGELLNVPASEFEKLGSSIAFAGVKAVATEEQILTVTREIATTAKMAKFSTPEIIGFATAMSSLGIAAESARGSTIRTFARINQAVSEGGEKLEGYARISGMSAGAFASEWSQNGQSAFDAFLKGLQKLSDEGQSLDTVLRDIGFVNVRDIQNVQKLGDNYDVYANSIREANQGFEEGSFLANAYGVTQETVAAKLQVIQNNLQNLFDTLGQSGVDDAFKDILDIITAVIKKLNEFASTPIGKALSLIVSVALALVVAIASINAIAAIARASMLAYATAMGLAKVSADGLTVSLQKAAVAKKILLTTGKALAFFAVITAITAAVGSMAVAFSSAQQKAENLLGGFGGLQDAITADADAYKEALAELGDDSAAREAVGVFGELSAAVENNNDEVNKNIEAQKNMNIFLGDTVTAVDETTDSVSNMNVMLGENTLAWYLNAVAQSDAFQKLVQNSEAMEAIAASGFNMKTAIEEAVSGDLDGYLSRVTTEALKGASGFDKFTFEALNLGNEVRALTKDFGVFGEVLGVLADYFGWFISLIPGLGAPVTKALEDAGNAARGVVATAALLGPLMGKAAKAAEDLDKGLDNGKNSAEGLARALRTVVDYANDLRSIFSRAMEITFGQQGALDKIAFGWANIADKADKAASAIADANAEIKELTADRSVLEYQLSVAERYGDEQRAAIIRAKLAKIDNRIIDQTEKKSNAEAELTKTTEGNSKAAIENRKVLTNMVGDYASLIEMYSKTGMKGKELKARITELRKEFRQQALEAGYSREEIRPYVKMFSEFKTIVDKTPRNVDVEFKANVSAANQALKEFIAKINRSSGTVTINTNYTGGQPPASGSMDAETRRMMNLQGSQPGASRTPFNPIGTRDNPYTTGLLPGMSTPARSVLSVPVGSFVRMPKGFYMHGITLSGNTMNLTYGKNKSQNNLDGKKITGNIVGTTNSMAGNLKALSRFARGGYVSGSGTRTSDSIPAMLSNGEFVIRASSVGTYGVDFLNALNQQKVGTFTSSSSSVNNMSGSTIAHLSPEDRALLRAVIDRPVNLYTENAKIATSANAGNVVLAQRGTN